MHEESHDLVVARQLIEWFPDVPRWVETRAILMRGECSTFGTMNEGGAVIVDQRTPLAAVVGRPSQSAMVTARQVMQSGAELLVMPESLEHVKAMLPDWEVGHATLHTLTSPIMPGGSSAKPRSGVVLFESVDGAVLEQLPDDLRHDARHATVIAAKRISHKIVSACYTNAITETLWDVGIATTEAHRRQGHARDCYLALAYHLARQGNQPTWGAVNTNIASLAMAQSLGFVPVDDLFIFFKKAVDRDRDRAADRPQSAAGPNSAQA